MHVVTGGAYNGKSAWVRQHYDLDARNDVCWLSAYKGDASPESIWSMRDHLLVFSGVELWVSSWLQHENLETVRDKGKAVIQDWLQWERQTKERRLIVIGSDISKGIVPMEKAMRDYRDAAGWFFQDLANASTRLDLIWYGISRQLK